VKQKWSKLRSTNNISSVCVCYIHCVINMDVLHKPSKSDSKKKNRYHGMCLFIAVAIVFTFTFS